jgi:Flp pilus assembly pilin Flp
MLTSTYIHTIWLRNQLLDQLRGRFRDDRGASLIEYAFLVVLIAVVCVGAVTLLGVSNNGSASRSASSIANAN